MRAEDQRAPTPRELAIFATYGLEYRLLTVDAVVRWADGMIESMDVPPMWVIDLALASNKNIDECLSCVPEVPEEVDRGLPLQLFLALSRLRWEQKKLMVDDVSKIAWRVYSELGWSNVESDLTWASYLFEELEEYEAGSLSEAELREAITGRFSAYASFESMILSWSL